MNIKMQELLKPELLNTVSGLELVARILAEGFMSGSNRSQSIGAGQEFSQYRNYETGDDMRQLDWKMYARSERYFIRQAEIETNITVKFMLDATHSMEYAESGISKLRYARVLIAALAYLARKQGDSIALYSVNDKIIRSVPPRFEQQQFMRFLNELIQTKAEGTWNRGEETERVMHHHGKEMIILATDLYDDGGDLQNFISRLKTRRNEVIVFHLMGQNEMNLGYSGNVRFADLETGKEILVNTPAEEAAYQARVKAWIRSSRDWMLSRQIDYKQINLDEDPSDVLRHFLNARKKMIR